MIAKRKRGKGFSVRAMSRGRGVKKMGTAKRLDEHRELWGLLTADAPEFLRSHWWVAGWFAATDEFLSGLLEPEPRSPRVPAIRPRPDYQAG